MPDVTAAVESAYRAHASPLLAVLVRLPHLAITVAFSSAEARVQLESPPR